MSYFIVEAAVVGVKEALKLGAVWFVFMSFLRASGRQGMLRHFYLGIAAASLLVALSFFFPPDMVMRSVVTRMVGYVFFVFFAAAMVALYIQRGYGEFPGWRLMGWVTAFAAVVYFSPDIIGSSMFVREISMMKESTAAVYASASAGFLIPLGVFFFTLRNRRWFIEKYFGTGQLLLFLALVKLLGGGTSGFAELSLVPAVQRGVMKFVHDFVHQTFVFLMVPDHPLLSTTTWNFIGILFGSNISMAISLLLLLALPLYFIYESLASDLPEPEGATTGAERRKFRAEHRADRIRKAVPVVVFSLVVLGAWYSATGERVSTLYDPAPKPVVEDKGMVIIPLTDPTMDLRDGRLYKFVLHKEGESIRFLVIRKPDGRLAVCLDACEICPPEGYGQTEGHVVCIYCMTPIPLGTLGKGGGCNPIPVEARVTEKDIRIDADELYSKWLDVLTGKTKAEVGR